MVLLDTKKTSASEQLESKDSEDSVSTTLGFFREIRNSIHESEDFRNILYRMTGQSVILSTF